MALAQPGWLHVMENDAALYPRRGVFAVRGKQRVKSGPSARDLYRAPGAVSPRPHLFNKVIPVQQSDSWMRASMAVTAEPHRSPSARCHRVKTGREDAEVAGCCILFQLGDR